MLSFTGLFLYITCILSHQTVYGLSNPLEVNWSPKNYGYDGPWHAVRVYIGHTKYRGDLLKPPESVMAQQVDLFPGTMGYTIVIDPRACENSIPLPPCPEVDKAGFYERNKSTTATHSVPGYFSKSGAWSLTSFGKFTLDQVNIGRTGDALTHLVPNCSIWIFEDSFHSYPNTVFMRNTIGALDLGTSVNFHNEMTLHKDKYRYTNIPSYLSRKHHIPSSSFGLHIGSVALDIPGSFWYGGYDQTRVIGHVLSQPFNEGGGGVFKIGLIDIGFSNAQGDPESQSINKSGLLLNPIGVYVEPYAPYIFLPKKVCDRMARELPVTYDSKLALYIWNTSSPKYASLSKSATFFTFTLQSTIEPRPIPINIPLQLLNLTLVPPLVEKPTQYFPCSPTSEAGLLGRAFLQAAFLGANWAPDTPSGRFFLAQAPGPNTNPVSLTKPIHTSDETIQPYDRISWEETWKDVWDAGLLKITPSSTSGGLSSGAKIGIGVGIGVGVVVLIISAVIFFLLGRRSAKEKDQSPPHEKSGREDISLESSARHSQLQEVPGSKLLGIPSNPAEVELSPVNEMVDSESGAAHELPSPVCRTELSV